MKKVILGIVFAIVLLVAGICVLPFLIPSSTYSNVAESRLEAMLGRDVTLGADSKITILPSLGARIQNVEIANAEGYEDPYFAKAEQLAISVKWLPLLSQRVEIASLKFVGADVRLHQKSETENNWTFQPASGSTETAQPSEDTESNFDAIIPKAELINSRVAFRDDVSGETYRLDPINLAARMEGLNAPLEVAGDVTFNGLAFDLAFEAASLLGLTSETPVPLKLNVESDAGKMSFDGRASSGETITADGQFDIALSDLKTLLNVFGVTLEQDLSVLGELSATGQLSGAPSNLALSNLSLHQDGPVSKANFTGDVTLSDALTISGQADFETSQMGALASAFEVETPYDLNALGNLSVSSRIEGSPDNLRANQIAASLKGPRLTAGYTGSASLVGDKPSASGTLTARSNALRGLLTDLGIVVESPNSSAFQTLAAELELSQTGDETRIDIETLQIDDIAPQGAATISVANERPHVGVTLDFETLDLSPYVSEGDGKKQNAPAAEDWSDEAIDFTALKQANADFDVSIGMLTDGRGVIRDVEFKGQLQNGVLSSRLRSLAPEAGRSGQPAAIDPLFAGSLDLSSRIDARENSNAVISIDTTGSGVTTAALIRYFTGMDVLQGVAALDADITTSGGSIADFVRNLDGTYQADIADGAILGVNLPQLLRSAREALLSGQLPSALSPEEKTDFSALTLNGVIANGVATIEAFQLEAPFIRASATGTIDLFNRTLDIRILPKAVLTAQGQTSTSGVNGYGIPLKVFGDWSSLKGSLDTDFIADLAKQEAASRLSDEVKSRLGGDVGNVLDRALGLPPSNNAPAEGQPTPSQDGSEAPAPRANAEEAAKSLLLDILSGKKESTD